MARGASFIPSSTTCSRNRHQKNTRVRRPDWAYWSQYADPPDGRQKVAIEELNLTSWSNCSFSAFISEVDTEHICRVLSIPSDPFQLNLSFGANLLSVEVPTETTQHCIESNIWNGCRNELTSKCVDVHITIRIELQTRIKGRNARAPIWSRWSWRRTADRRYLELSRFRCWPHIRIWVGSVECLVAAGVPSGEWLCSRWATPRAKLSAQWHYHPHYLPSQVDSSKRPRAQEPSSLLPRKSLPFERWKLGFCLTDNRYKSGFRSLGICSSQNQKV